MALFALMVAFFILFSDGVHPLPSSLRGCSVVGWRGAVCATRCRTGLVVYSIPFAIGVPPPFVLAKDAGIIGASHTGQRHLYILAIFLSKPSAIYAHKQFE
jgi:hypothetical protein